MFSANFHAKPFRFSLIGLGRLGWMILALFGVASVADARPFAYVANADSDTLSVIDLATGVVIRTVVVGNGPAVTSVTPDGRFIYVIGGLTPRGISVVDAETYQVANTISGLPDPTDIVFSPDGRLAYVTNGTTSGTVSVIDTGTRVVVKTIAVGRTPNKLVVSPDGSYLYVINTGTSPDNISVIRTADNTAVNTITVGRGALGAVVSRDGSRLYVVNRDDDTVSVIDVSNGIGNGVIRTFNVIDLPAWIAISPDGKRIYVVRTTSSQGQVVEVNTETGATIGSPINVGASPRSIAISPNGSHLYTTTLTGNPDSMVEINLATRAVKNIAVGADPSGVAVSPLQGVLATTSAASFGSGPIAGEAIGAIFGSNLAGGVHIASTLPLPTQLGGTVVKVKDSVGIERLAAIFFVSPNQINYQIPAGTAAGNARVTVSHTHGFVSTGDKMIAGVAPGLFSANGNGQGVAAAVLLRVRADGSQSAETVASFDQAQGRFVPLPIDLGPASDQLFLILFGTGLRFRSSLAAASATIGGVNSEVLFVGAQGGLVGLDQVNLRLPRSLAGRGIVDIELRADGQVANIVQVSIR
jgi:uncharacterized protein (TIGR03437 family)